MTDGRAGSPESRQEGAEMAKEFTVMWREGFGFEDGGYEEFGTLDAARAACIGIYRSWMDLFDDDYWKEASREEFAGAWNAMIGEDSCWVERVESDGRVWAPSAEELEAIGWKKI